MEGGLLASGILLLVFPAAHSWPAVLTMIMLFALATETFRPANMSLIGELAPPELRKPAFALHRWAVNLGMSVGPALGGFLAQKSFRLLFFVDGMSTLSAVAILYFSSFHLAVRARETEEPGVDAPWPMAAFFRDSDFRFFLLAILPVSIVFFQHEGAMPLFLVRNLHFSESAYGLLFTLNTLMIITLEIPLNAATAHWSFRRTLTLGASLFALGFGALAVSHTYFEVALTVVIWTFGEMILFPSMSAYVSQIAPKNRHGEYMGLYMMTFSLAFTVGPWIGTLALDHFGPVALWSATLVAGLFSAGVLGRVGGDKIAGN
jgi:MFS family permease